jgi:hypothetical protein
MINSASIFAFPFVIPAWVKDAVRHRAQRGLSLRHAGIASQNHWGDLRDQNDPSSTSQQLQKQCRKRALEKVGSRQRHDTNNAMRVSAPLDHALV